MIDASNILNQTPCSGSAPTLPAPEHEEIAAVFEDMIASGGINNLETARVAAFAWYNGVEKDAVLEAFRLSGTAEILRTELAVHQQPAIEAPYVSMGQRFPRQSSYLLARELKRPDLGWALVVLTVAVHADIDAILDCLAPAVDPSRIATLYLSTWPFIAPEDQYKVMKSLLALDDALATDVATDLMQIWIEFGVSRPGNTPEGAFAAIEEYPAAGAMILGAIITSTARYYGPRVAPDVIERANVIDQRVDEAGKKVFKDRRAINLALKRAGIHDLEVLSALCRWSADKAFATTAAKALGHAAKEYLDLFFGSRQNLTEYQAASCRTPTKWSQEALVDLISKYGIDVDVFQGYVSGFATDSFSRMTRRQLSHGDRQRSIVLLAATGLAAANRNDPDLLDAVRSAAERLRLQPEGPVMPLDQEQQNDFVKRCGFTLPSR
jgi:hypothetical protein